MSTTKELNYTIELNKDRTISKSVYLKISDKHTHQMYLIHRALKQQITNNRIRNAHSKTRSEVRGGGKKPWKQKGTGRARAGSSRSPLWKGGGVIFGPRQKTYKSKINKKEKRLAINTILANKINQTIIISEILTDINKPNTKQGILAINKCGIKLHKNKKLLLITSNKTKVLHLSLRNINNLELIEVSSINVLSLLKADIIMMTDNALEKINQTFK